MAARLRFTGFKIDFKCVQAALVVDISQMTVYVCPQNSIFQAIALSKFCVTFELRETTLLFCCGVRVSEAALNLEEAF